MNIQHLKLYDGAQYSDDYLRLSPNHAVPVLEITWDSGKVQRLLGPGYGTCRDDVFKGYMGRLAQRPAFAAALADAREFLKQVPHDKPLVTRFTG